MNCKQTTKKAINYLKYYKDIDVVIKKLQEDANVATQDSKSK